MEIDKNYLQKEVLDNIPTDCNSRLILAPRSGKSKIIIDFIKKEKPKSILWVSKELKLLEVDVPSEFVKWKAKTYLKRLTTSTWMSLNKLVGHYDLIILDEDQAITTNNSVNLINKTLTGMIISMTGTPSTDDEKRELYYKLDLKIAYNFNINKAVDTGILSDYDINIVNVPISHSKDFVTGSKDKKFTTSEYNNYQYLSSRMMQAFNQGGKNASFMALLRMKAIHKSPTKLRAAQKLIHSLKGRKIIFSSDIKQAETLSEHTYHSKTDNKSYLQFKDGEVDTLSMVNSGGTGHTYKAIDHLILVQADSNNNGQSGQKICRTLMKQKDYKAKIWVICLLGTQDEKWVDSLLSSFNRSKVNYYNIDSL